MDKEEKKIVIKYTDIYLKFPEIMEDEVYDLLATLEDEHYVCEDATDVFINLQNKVKKQKEVLDKLVDKLYCWGETLNPTFQKEMLDILKEVSE